MPFRSNDTLPQKLIGHDRGREELLEWEVGVSKRYIHIKI